MRFELLLTLGLLLAFRSVEADPISVVVRGERLHLPKAPVMLDSRLYVPIAVVEALGAKCELRDKETGSEQPVNIKSARGEQFEASARLLDGKPMLPIADVGPRLGAVVVWDATAEKLTLRSKLECVEFDGVRLTVKTSFPVTFSDAWWKAENKLILDLHGVHMPPGGSGIMVKNSTPVAIRMGVRDAGDTGRIVLDMPHKVGYRVNCPKKTMCIELVVEGYRKPSVEPEKSETEAKTIGSENEPVPSPTPPPPPTPTVIEKIEAKVKESRRVEVVVSTDKPLKFSSSMTRNPDTLVVEIPNSKLQREFGEIQVESEPVRSVRVEGLDGPVVKLTMNLTRVVGFDIYSGENGGGLVIEMELPKGAGGKLSQRTVVIDPGHGGVDTGAIGLGGWREKDSNLAIALRVRRRLAEAGACALMTRKTDVRLNDDKKTDLAERANYAKRHSADMLISIHSNSVSGTYCPSGVITFYHGRDKDARALAYCIHSELVKAAGLPDLGVRSDLTVYQTGFGVLRAASELHGIPAVLLEIGYVKHPVDVEKLKNPDFQEKVAEAIVHGLKVYVEGSLMGDSSKRRDTKLADPVNMPQPLREDKIETVPENPVDRLEISPQPLSRPLDDTGPHRPWERLND